MANFLESIFVQLKRADDRVVLREIHGANFTTVTGNELLAQVQRARGYIRRFGLLPGDRCALAGREFHRLGGRGPGPDGRRQFSLSRCIRDRPAPNSSP